MKIVTVTAKNEKAAITLAAKELDANESDYNWNVNEKSSHGFLGLGGKEYIVRASKGEYDLEQVKQEASAFLEAILRKCNEICDIETSYDSENDVLLFDIIGGSSGRIIGYHGENIDALRVILKAMLERITDGNFDSRFNIDCEGYLEKRREMLIDQANRIASRVKKYNRPLALEPMNAHDRRIIHFALTEVDGIETCSIGKGSRRKVLVKPEGYENY
ncbi:MAG: Jag N-terminal domain-containing protein [Clostridiales bacterium]|jgi:spoIIIJ-associated protein|nr:Jag N-terminal domain-containing protein [Clostridiales bacterium]